MQHATFAFDEIGRIPLPGDNVAIATRRLEAGTRIVHEGQSLTLDYTVMEGHRFAIRPIAPGEHLLSWELPFGVATRAIAPGHYVINPTTLGALGQRNLDFALPPAPNFEEDTQVYTLDEATFRPAEAPAPHAETRTFMGYKRSAARGVGTRNTIVLLGTTSQTGGFVTQLADRLRGVADAHPNLDGIVPAAHTEGGAAKPNNLGLLLRTLAGFMVNPNVGAVLAVDYGTEPVTNRMLEDYMRRHGYPLGEVRHRFLTLEGGFEQELDRAEAVVRSWVPEVAGDARTAESLRHLKVGMQCGGSDAFSGISGNPLQGWVAKELIRYGGAASLAETDELIGAEPYVLSKVRDLDTAQRFLDLVARFRERAGWHGASAEGNPSGGNMYRGLYNIALKSIGAAQKKDPETRLDYVIEYGEAMPETGYYFMDSPGNDLESIAGQVASGCNMIFFATGNGSITNFPFVPTIKIVTTTERYELLPSEMDVNAGAYLEGTPMEELGRQTFELTVQVASGQLSAGERAGHSQVQIWRDWAQTDGSRLASLLEAQEPQGLPLPLRPVAGAAAPADFAVARGADGGPLGRIGLIVPTSLCAGQVAAGIAEELNRSGPLARYVTLPHTEGCGNSGGNAEQLFARAMVGYALHPAVGECLLLEHGCEKTHNDYMRRRIAAAGEDPSRFGYASIQLDGGIDAVSRKVTGWFAQRPAAEDGERRTKIGLDGLRIGLMASGPLPAAAVREAAALTSLIVQAGGTVAVPENSSLLEHAAYRELFEEETPAPSLAYGDSIREDGFHIMATPTGHWVETMTGLAATGVELIVALVHERPMQAHPFVPVLQVSGDASLYATYRDDLDLLLPQQAGEGTERLLGLTRETLERRYAPKLQGKGNTGIQFTRGLLGVSL
ncbi:UxaA family hydrolase [Paenibacillus sp. IB182496]|uniref:UxaA family hydrolase n=1 Tax=Paenibacillus sabuli TaxID=2772509 RepID=A0A927GS48_9BACL|nr:UxaA family hydrolase [Paenibacillus sabuli]MBD2845342.1 UxaA family hydrolase [Paenibacillus sabuli]